MGIHEQLKSSTFREFQLFTPEECNKVIEAAEKHEPHQALVQHKGLVNADMPDVRITTTHYLDYENDFEIIEKVRKQGLKENVWGFETHKGREALPIIQVLKYEIGGYYKQHTDWGGSHINRKFSMTVQLSNEHDYVGCEVLLSDGPELAHMVRKDKGWATIFPAWTLHGVKPLAEGVRWSLVAWFLGEPYR